MSPVEFKKRPCPLSNLRVKGRSLLGNWRGLGGRTRHTRISPRPPNQPTAWDFVQSGVRDWSLNTGRGGLQNGRGGGGAREVLPLRKGGAEKVLAMLKGGGGQKKFWGSF